MSTEEDDLPVPEAIARLTIYSDSSSADEIEVRIGLKPDEKWNKGEPWSRGRTYTTTAIEYHSPGGADSEPADQLADLLTRIEPLAESLAAEREAGSQVRLKLALFEDTDNVMFSLPADLLTRIGSLGLELEFDIYP